METEYAAKPRAAKLFNQEGRAFAQSTQAAFSCLAEFTR